ncbi:MAG: DUF61 family protein [Fervidicoccaceae archaeon]
MEGIHDSNAIAKIEMKVLEDLKRINDDVVEYITLENANNKDMEIALKSGEKIILRCEDIEKLKRKIPGHLRSKLKLPIEINIIISEEQIMYRINGDLWQIRMVNYIRNEKLMWKPSEEINAEYLSDLITNYPSLIRLKLVMR